MNSPLIKKIVAAVIALFAPVIVWAQTNRIPVPNPGNQLPGSSQATVGTAITSILTGILLPVAGIIAVLFIIIGGFQYMLSGANEELAKKGKTTLRNAIIGIIIVVLSYVVIQVVVNTFTRTYV